MILSAWQAVRKACGNVGGVDVTGGASKARMPEMNAQTTTIAQIQNHTSIHRPSPTKKLCDS